MSNGLVLSFLRRPSNSEDWTQQELAEFYRVESALLQGGFAVTTDRGISDEGDPWFIFCRADNEEVIAHFARIDREYVIVSSFFAGAARGRDFRLLIREMLNSHPLMLPIRRSQGQKVFLHPAALLTALLASAYVLSSEKDLVGDNVSVDGHSKNSSIASLLLQKFSILAAAAFAATWIDHQANSIIKFFENGPLAHSPLDEKATHVAVTHDVAQFDAAIVQSVELGAHRHDSSDPALKLPATQDGESQEIVALKQSTNPNSAHNASDKSSDVNAAVILDHANDAHTPSGSSDAVQGDSSSVVVLGNLQPAMSVASVAAELTIANQSSPTSQATTENVQGFSLPSSIVTTDAFHLAASEISTFSTQTLLLSSDPVPLSVALHQSFLQVGYSADPLHSLPVVAVDTSVVNNGAPTTGLAQSPTASAPVVPVTQSANASGSQGTASSAGASAGEVSQVEQAVQAFLLDNPSYEITVSGLNVIIIDTNVADVKSPNFGSMSWDMSDGSTLSIVGIVPSHAHAIAA